MKWFIFAAIWGLAWFWFSSWVFQFVPYGVWWFAPLGVTFVLIAVMGVVFCMSRSEREFL